MDAGIALDAQARGMRYCIIAEMQDFVTENPNLATKLVYGGLRYLKKFHVKQVAELKKSQ